jgi:Sulfotransferase family
VACPPGPCGRPQSRSNESMLVRIGIILSADEKDNIMSAKMIKVPLFLHERLIFLHIEKTGGSAVTDHLSKFFYPEEICPERAARFSYWLPSQLEKFRFFSAHSHMKDLQAIPGPAKYITVVRDPIERSISYYEFLRYQDDGAIPYDPRIAVAKELDVNNFFVSAPTNTLHAVSNHMTACLTSGERPITRETLKIAKRNLDEFFAVGIFADMTSFMEQIHDGLGLGPFDCLPTVNTTDAMRPDDDRLRIKEIEPKVLSQIEELNRFDLELYAYASKRSRGLSPGPVNVKLFIAETLPSIGTRAGCVVGPESYAGYVLHGPYCRLFPGTWTARFYVAVEPAGVQSQDIIVEIDVYSSTVGHALAHRDLRRSDFNWPAFTMIDLEVATDVLLFDVEFRISKGAGSRLVCRDEITLTQAPVPHYEKSIPGRNSAQIPGRRSA